MNFFEQQHKARSNSAKLVALFVLAIIVIIVIIDLLILGYFFMSEKPYYFNYEVSASDRLLFYLRDSWQIFCFIGLVIAVFIVSVSLYKKWQLSRGGAKLIAQSLGCQLIAQDTKDPKQRQLLNIVEEIAVASCLPVPSVYLIKEDGINAFAAGTNPRNAIIGVTSGALINLNRDELQGVIAHEFSHILNGDTKLNIDLIATLHGLVIIYLFGRLIVSHHLRRAAFSRDRKGGVFLFGLAIIIIGGIGVFVGNLIRAAVTRQREYLADASAVQFTRNPSGIGNALKKIGGLSEGSKITHEKAPEFSHLFFGESESHFISLMASHPPLASRISLIDSNWDGKFITPNPANSIWKISKENMAMPKESNVSKNIAIDSAVMMNSIKNIGSVPEKSIIAATKLIDSMPEIIKDYIHDSAKVSSVIYALFIKISDGYSQEHLDILQINVSPDTFSLIGELHGKIENLDKKFYIPIIEMATMALKQLSYDDYQIFKKNIKEITRADAKVSIFEWMLERILFDSLDREFNKPQASKKANYSLKDIQNEIGLFLSLLAYAGSKNHDLAKKAFDKAINDQKLTKIPFIAKSGINAKTLDESALKLEQLKPLEKEKLIKMCVTCIAYDEKNSSNEIELFRAFCSILNCPMPL